MNIQCTFELSGFLFFGHWVYIFNPLHLLKHILENCVQTDSFVQFQGKRFTQSTVDGQNLLTLYRAMKVMYV